MHGRGQRQREADRGQTETIGVVLVLGMTLVGATVALAFGASGIDAARLNSQEGSIEHAMTQLDSRAAMVALGDSSFQRVPMATTGSGGYHADPEAGRIVVTHNDYDGSGSEEEIYNATLGALTYQNGDKRIAYQGGGVWVAQGATSRMISPPELHYQSATLTLPIIQVDEATSAGGSGVTAAVSKADRTTRVYPNETGNYGGGQSYQNPIREGNVTVTVTSDYYQAWAHYFRTRTSGNVTVDHDTRTASVLLISRGTYGNFQMPADGNSIELRGIGDDHPITEFEVTVRPDDADSANFANLQWSIYAEQGNQRFEIHLRDGGSNDDPSTPCTERDVDATVYYSDSNGDPYHGWHEEGAFRTSCDDLDGDGDNETYLLANLTGTTELEMDTLSGSQLQHFSTNGDDLQEPIVFDEHGAEIDWEDPGTTFNEGDRTTMDNLTNHYLSLMGPNVELTIEDKGSDTVNEAESTGNFEQSGSAGQFVTFLHITENRVTIELE